MGCDILFQYDSVIMMETFTNRSQMALRLESLLNITDTMKLHTFPML